MLGVVQKVSITGVTDAQIDNLLSSTNGVNVAFLSGHQGDGYMKHMDYGMALTFAYGGYKTQLLISIPNFSFKFRTTAHGATSFKSITMT